MSSIVALGGGGFLMEETGLLDDFVLERSGKDHPKILFLAQASGEAESVLVKFYRAFAGKAHADHLSLFRRDERSLESRIAWADVIYVGGGNTANMLAIWRLHGVDALLATAQESTVLAGVSAGANCWFESSTTDSFGGVAALQDGLGFLTGSCCPHFSNEPGRRPAYERWLTDGTIAPGIALDDNAAAHYRQGKLAEVVTSAEDAAAYEGAQLTSVPTRYLG